MTAAVSYSPAATSFNGSASFLAVPAPPAYGPGDFLLMAVTGGDSSGNPVAPGTPDGWTALSSEGAGLGVFWKSAGTEPASYTVTMAAACCASGFAVAYPAATVSGTPSFDASDSGATSFTPTAPGGIEDSQLVLLVGAAVASSTQNAGYQNFDFPDGLDAEVPVFGPAVETAPSGVYPCCTGLSDVAGADLPGTLEFTSPQDCTILTGIIVLDVTGTNDSLTVTAMSSYPEGHPGLALTVAALGGAATPQEIASGGATKTFYAGGSSQAPQASVAPNKTGSYVYGAVTENYGVAGGTVFTANDATMFSQNTADAAWNAVYGTFRSSGTVTEGTPVTLGGTAPDNAYTTAVLAEILPASGQTLFESAVAVAAGTVPGDFATASVAQGAVLRTTPADGTLLVAMVSANSLYTQGNISVTVSDSSGLAWVRLAEVAYPSYSGIWAALVPSPAPPAPGSFTFAPGMALPGAATPGVPAQVAAPAPPPGPVVMQQKTGLITSAYGFSTTEISTSEGSWLVAFIGWNCVTPGSYVQVPAVSVTDSAGNLWQQAGISRAGYGVASTTRAAVWVCPNALPVSWVSPGLTGFAASVAWTIAEITGMPQAADVDFSVSVNTGGSTPSLTWTAQDSGTGFAVVAAGNAAETVTSSPSGWSGLEAVTAGSGTDGVALFPYWDTSIAPATGTTSLSLGTAASYSYVLCSLSSAASPPAQPSPWFPGVIVQAAFGAQPGDVSASTDFLFSSEYVTWTDITSRVIGPAVTGRIKTKRGRQYQLQQQEAGTMSAPLSNVDGAFTPTNPGSPFYSNALNANMSFQPGISPWTALGGAQLSLSSDYAYASGLNAIARYSMLVSPDGSSATPGASSELVPVSANYPCTASFTVYCPQGWESGAYPVIRWCDASGDLISSTVGTPVSVPAAQWTQVTVTGHPPSGTVYAGMDAEISGTPSADIPFYVAEAGIATGQVLRTGLIAPLAPVRVTAWWQGRQYPVWAGYAQQWPQEWPDLPQWGFSTLKAADALGVAAAGQMQSALIGEVLIDNPYAYLPCNESYTTNITGANSSNQYIYAGGYYAPADANGLPAVNRANNNQVTGTYLDGAAQQASTGLTMNFQGDNGTGMGATGYSSAQTGSRGPSMLYQDPGLSAIGSSSDGFTIEFWFSWGGSSTQAVTLLSAYGTPSAFTWDSADPTPNGTLVGIWITGGDLVVSTATDQVTVPVSPSSSPQHCAVEFTAASPAAFTVWLNGEQSGSGLADAAFPAAAMQAIVLGCGRYSCDAGTGNVTYYAYNYSAGHLAVYAYQLSQARISAHWKTGAAGQSGVRAAIRAGQVMTWAQLGLKRGGWSQGHATGNAEATQMGPAYSLDGQSAAAALWDVQQSEGGRELVQANGSLAYLERGAAYNLPVSAVFSDGTAAAPVILNTDPGFASGLAGWTVSGGEIGYDRANAYGGLGSLSFTPGGGTSPVGSITASSPSFSWNGGSATAGFWLNAPYGGEFSCGMAGLGTATALLPAGAWTFLSAPVPAGSAGGVALFAGGTAPFYLAWAAAWNSAGVIPYDPKSSYGFDQTYIYNEVTATQQDGPNQLVLYDARGTASQAQYFRRSALSFTPNVVSPYDVSDITTWNLNQYQQPALHVSAVTVMAAPDPLACFPAILPLDEGQVTQVNRNPLGGAAITETGTVERISHEIGAGYWKASYQMSPYGPAQSVLSLDTPGLDDPGANGTLTLAWLQGTSPLGGGSVAGERGTPCGAQLIPFDAALQFPHAVLRRQGRHPHRPPAAHPQADGERIYRLKAGRVYRNGESGEKGAAERPDSHVSMVRPAVRARVVAACHCRSAPTTPALLRRSSSIPTCTAPRQAELPGWRSTLSALSCRRPSSREGPPTPS